VKKLAQNVTQPFLSKLMQILTVEKVAKNFLGFFGNFQKTGKSKPSPPLAQIRPIW
jgi:hypothetical protein